MAGIVTLLAIPFFCSGALLHVDAAVAKRIIRSLSRWSGHFPGGLAIAGVFACMLFAALSGSCLQTVVAIGSHRDRGDAVKLGYTKEFAAGVSPQRGAPWAS